jgi:hypothetical protein
LMKKYFDSRTPYSQLHICKGLECILVCIVSAYHYIKKSQLLHGILFFSFSKKGPMCEK